MLFLTGAALLTLFSLMTVMTESQKLNDKRTLVPTESATMLHHMLLLVPFHEVYLSM